MSARHPQAVAPGPGQESVWDYPRPPRWEVVDHPVEVWFGGQRIAATARSVRLLETSHPPTYYLPESSFSPGVLRPTSGTSFCEWKGSAEYLDLVLGEHLAERAAWRYPHPKSGFDVLLGHVSLYPAAVDRCVVAGEEVRPQPGGFYGGWITSKVVGPFKGGPGTMGW